MDFAPVMQKSGSAVGRCTRNWNMCSPSRQRLCSFLNRNDCERGLRGNPPRGIVLMADALRKDGILDVIRSLAAKGATGRLQISTGMTDGALFFDRGELVDARLANLRGFQAINALVSVPEGSYSFDPAIRPAQQSLTANERVLLKDFFGIEAGNNPQLVADDDDDEVTLVRPTPAVAEPPVTEPPALLPEPPPGRSAAFRPALFFILLLVLIGVGTFALVYHFLARPSQPSHSTASVAQAPAPADVPAQPTTSATPNLTGNWNVVNTVDQTSYQAYKNMKVGFTVSINQTGKDFTGKGEKISENGRTLPSTSRTPIEVRGTIDGDKVEATFSESGALRKTNGRFVWRIDKTNGGLTGTFVSTAAGTSGRSAAKKGL